jgi:hypothetical protein
MSIPRVAVFSGNGVWRPKAGISCPRSDCHSEPLKNAAGKPAKQFGTFDAQL